MTQSKLVLPRTNKDGEYYLSYSQISTWKRSKREYIRQYFLGEAFEGNAYTDFGSKVGEALEDNDFTGFTAKETKFLKTIPRYDEFEREIKLRMDGFHIKGFIDTNTVDLQQACGVETELVDKIADYKTGDVDKKAAEYESDDYIQLDLYSAAIKQDTGQLPKEVKVFLIHRTGNAFKNEKLKLGDEFVTITKKITQERIDQVLGEVQIIAEEISQYYKMYLKMSLV
jgi:hypothetical protein